MPTLNIGNQNVQVDDSFLSLSPDQQNATVDEIAGSLGGGSAPQSGNASQLNGVGAPTTPQEESSTIGDIAKSAGSGAVRGVLGLGQLPNLAAKGIDYLTGDNLESYTQPLSDKISQWEDANLHTPQSQAGNAAELAGEFIPNLIGGPETLATKLITRVAAPAIGSHYGGEAAQALGLPQGVGQVAGAVLGGAAPTALGRAISPIAAVHPDAIKTLASEGMDTGALSAGMVTGSGALKYTESELGDALGAGGQSSKATNRAMMAYTAAAANKVPELAGAQALTPDVLNAGRQAIGQTFDQLAASNPAITLDNQFGNDVSKIKSDFTGLTGNQPTLIDGFMNRLNQTNPAAPVISGATYQTIRSEVGDLARRASLPEVENALYSFQHALDGAVFRNLSNPADKAAWQQARQSWLNTLILQKAVNSSAEAASSGLVTPANLKNAIERVQQGGYTLGRSDFAELARAGNQVMKQMPQSGTAPRTAAHLIPTIAGALIGHGIPGLGPVAGGVLGPAVAGRTLMSRPAQAYLKNQIAAPLRRAPAVRNAIRGGVLGYGAN